MTAQRPDLPTPDDIVAIRDRADAATEGPWDADISDADMSGRHRWQLVVRWRRGPSRTVGSLAMMHGGDAEFISAARTDVPALLAWVEALTGELAEAEFCTGCNGGEWTWQRRAEQAEAKVRKAVHAQMDAEDDRDAALRQLAHALAERDAALARIARVEPVVEAAEAWYRVRHAPLDAVFDRMEEAVGAYLDSLSSADREDET